MHQFREGKGCSFYECLHTYGMEWYGSRTCFDQRKEATQSMCMDLALARRSGQELHNTYYITRNPEFGPLRRFFVSAVIQLQCAFNHIPVPSRQLPSTDTPLLESIHADIDYDNLSGEDTTTADCAGAWDAGMPLMVAETFPHLEGGVRASLEETDC